MGNSLGTNTLVRAQQRQLERLQALASLDYNYDEKIYVASKDKQGWSIDHYSALLATEPPGPPLTRGAFDVAKTAVRLYQFAEPRLISAVFDPEAALYGRNMLLFAKFAGFTFSFGVRVTEVIDETRLNAEQQEVKVWGYSYRTLKGHFEVGEIRFEVSKNLSTGSVDFAIDAYSKPERIPNPFFRMGFRVFGRPLQRYFAHSSIHRLQRLAKTALRQQEHVKESVAPYQVRSGLSPKKLTQNSEDAQH